MTDPSYVDLTPMLEARLQQDFATREDRGVSGPVRDNKRVHPLDRHEVEMIGEDGQEEDWRRVAQRYAVILGLAILGTIGILVVIWTSGVGR